MYVIITMMTTTTMMIIIPMSFLANVNYVLSPVRLSSVCNVRAPYSAGCNFPQCFNVVWYLGHSLTFTGNFTEIVSGEPLRYGS